MTRKHKLTAHDAEPLYVTIPLEEYKKLKEVEKLYKNIMKIDKILSKYITNEKMQTSEGN